MGHMQWWLFALSFVMGLVLTLALRVRPVKRQVPVGTRNGRGATVGAEPEPPATVIPADKEVIPVAIERPAATISVEQAFETTKVPPAEESPTTTIPAEEAPGNPVAEESPKTRTPFLRRFRPKRAPTADE